MSTTPEITGRARGGGNGRPAAVQCMAGGLVPRNSVRKHGSKSTPQRQLRRYLPVRPATGSARAADCPDCAPMLPPRRRRQDPPPRAASANSFSINQLGPTPVSGPETHQNRFGAHEPLRRLPRLIGIGIVGAFHAQSFAISRRLRWRGFAVACFLIGLEVSATTAAPRWARPHSTMNRALKSDRMPLVPSEEPQRDQQARSKRTPLRSRRLPSRACSMAASRWSAPLGSRRWHRSPDAASPNLPLNSSPVRAFISIAPPSAGRSYFGPSLQRTRRTAANAGCRRIARTRLFRNHSKAQCASARHAAADRPGDDFAQAEPLKCQRLVGPGLANGDRPPFASRTFWLALGRRAVLAFVCVTRTPSLALSLGRRRAGTKRRLV